MGTHLARGSRILAVTAALALAVSLAPVGASLAQEPGRAKDTFCGWNGNVIPLMEQADRRVRSKHVTAQIKARMGENVKIAVYTRMEVDLQAAPGATTSPTDATTLTRINVFYNVRVADSRWGNTATALVSFDGLCYRATGVTPGPWPGSTGTDKPLRVNANKALKFAQEYRRKHPGAYPLNEPLLSMNLMQATTATPDAPPDPALPPAPLRWFVSYDNGSGGQSILSVWMNGRVDPI